MGCRSADIEALLVDVNDPDNLTAGTLPAIFRDIVGRLDAAGLTYAVVGRIALALHERARSWTRSRSWPTWVEVS